MRKSRNEISTGMIERGERKRTADDVSKDPDDVKTGPRDVARTSVGARLRAPRAASGIEAA